MSQSNHIPICPKCGYDQSGEIATWQDQCPMEGRCPECGLEFSWANVLDPNLIDLPWFVEHAKTKREMLRRTLPTLWMMMIPNRYWKRVTMETGRSTKRFVAWFVMLMIALHLMGSIAMIGSRVGYTIYDTNQLEQMKIGESAAFQARIDGMKTQMDGAYWANVIADSILYPLGPSRFFDTEIAEIAFGLAFFSLGIACMWLILMCAFPTTRKRSQLRMVHVVRAAVVSGSMSMVVMELGRIMDAVSTLGYSLPGFGILQNRGTAIAIAVVMVVGMLVWVQWFWWIAVWSGWKIKARWFELALVMLASLIGGLVIGGGLGRAVLAGGKLFDSWLGGYI